MKLELDRLPSDTVLTNDCQYLLRHGPSDVFVIGYWNGRTMTDCMGVPVIALAAGESVFANYRIYKLP